jgi:short-subunit dehydrogenase
LPTKRRSLIGRTALITGAGSGIGRALAIEASRRGLAVALVGRRLAPLEATRELIEPAASSLVIAGDVTCAVARSTIHGRITREWGRLDVLVNNAGIVSAGPLAEITDAELERLVATNLLAPLALTRDLLPLLRAAAPSRVVNIGSLVGDVALPLFAAYAASKFGLRGLSNALRRELREFAIGVTYVAPRGTRTDAAAAVAPFLDPKMPLDSPDAIAGQVWDAVAGGRDSAYPRGRERLFVLVERLCPAIVTRALTAPFGAARDDDGLVEIAAAGVSLTPRRKPAYDGGGQC